MAATTEINTDTHNIAAMMTWHGYRDSEPIPIGIDGYTLDDIVTEMIDYWNDLDTPDGNHDYTHAGTLSIGEGIVTAVVEGTVTADGETYKSTIEIMAIER